MAIIGINNSENFNSASSITTRTNRKQEDLENSVEAPENKPSQTIFPGSARRKNRNPLSDKDIPFIFTASDNSRHDYFDKHDKGTAFIYDERMLLHKNIWFPNFVECPERFSATIDKCITYGLLSRCLIINPEPATDDLLTLYHQTDYVEQINQTTTMADDELKQLSATLDSVYFNKHTDLSARLSVGSWIQAIDLIHRGDVRNAFCLVRPPGHHALTNEACGFCIYNNVAIAANYAIEQLNFNRLVNYPCYFYSYVSNLTELLIGMLVTLNLQCQNALGINEFRSGV
ncbi:unnamed protein product [Schistosoma mattheei]|uniref:histone deacetylase n=1 Tax=Schistosoma mattheei TaxID=31246 RepID=A0A183NTL7_9TREM|nr:unnamed protein product [Schistosoma mattheei]